MRLTVHVTGVKKFKVEKKDSEGKINTFWKCPSTLSFENVQPGEEGSILASIEKDGQGTPVHHYFSNDRVIGRSKGPKKKS